MTGRPGVWVAEPHEAEVVARLLIGFRDHLGYAGPSDNSILASVERLMEDTDTDYLLGAPHDDAPPAGVAQLRYRWGIWRAGLDCLVEDVFVEEHARRSGLGRALVAAALDRARERGARRAELDVNERNEAALRLYGAFGFSSSENAYGGRDLYLRLHLDPPG